MNFTVSFNHETLDVRRNLTFILTTYKIMQTNASDELTVYILHLQCIIINLLSKKINLKGV